MLIRSAVLGVLVCVTAAGADLTGKVEDTAGAVVVGARITLMNASMVLAGSAVSDGEGRFRLAVGAAGSYQLRVEKEGFAAYQAAVQVPSRDGSELRVRLTVSPVRSEVTVSAEAGEVTDAAEQVQRVNLIARNLLDERVTTVLTEAAQEEVGVAEQRTAPAMGSFFVRGLTGKNVAVYRDGIRYTTSAQRGGVSTFQNLVDSSWLESVEMVRGPNGAQYGSDSMGGAVSLVSRGAELTQAGRRVAGTFGTFYQSASNAFGADAQGRYSTPRFGLTAAGAGRRSNSVRSGGGLDSHAAVTRFLGIPSDVLGARLPDTAFTQYGGQVHGQVQASPLDQLVFHYERGQQDAAKRYDQLLGGDGNLIADLRNLMLDFGYLRYQRFKAGPLDQWRVSGSYNAQREERVNQGGQGNPMASITHQYEKTRAWGLETLGQRRVNDHALAVGGEGYREEITAPAYTYNPVNGTVTLTRPRVPDGARYLNYGIFVQDVWEPERANRLRLSGALRFGGASYKSRAANSPLVGGRPLWPDDSLATNALSGRGGATIKIVEGLSATAAYSRGYRAPNVTDLGTLGLQGNGNYESSAADLAGRDGMVGDRADALAKSTGVAVAKLHPEISDNFEAGMLLTKGRVRADFTWFTMKLDNTVVSQTLLLPPGQVGQPLGGQTISRQLESGAVYVPVSTNPVLVRANYSGARIKGVEQSLRVQLSRAWTISENLTWVEAKDAKTGLPPDIEPGIPAPQMNVSLLYSPASRRFWVEAYSTLADRQERLSSLALGDRRIGAARSRSNIASFFNNGARVHGLVVNGRLVPTNETLAEVQNRVLGTANSAPMFTAIPGYGIVGIRAGVPVTRRSEIMLDFSNIADHNWRGIGWGIDAYGRAVAVRWRVRM